MRGDAEQPITIRPTQSDTDERSTQPNPSELHSQIEVVLESQIRPLLKMHGGGIDLLAVSDQGAVTLEFLDACRGCSLKSVTYALGIRQRLMQLRGVTRVEMKGVRLSDAALKRVADAYDGYSFWADAS